MSAAERALSPAEERKAALRRLARLLSGDVELPRLDPGIASLHQFLQTDDFHMQEVADVVGGDPSVAAGVVRVANTAHYSRGSTVGSLRDAVVRIGPKQVVAVALEVGVAEQFACDAEPFAGLIRKMWRNAIVTSRIAAELARALERKDPERIQVAALFHNIGEMVVVQLLADAPGERSPGEKMISALVRINHQRLGRQLTRKWMLPHPVRRLAGAHHDVRPGSESKEEKRVRQIVLAAWALAVTSGYRYLPGHERVDPYSPLEALGLGSDVADRIAELIEAWEV